MEIIINLIEAELKRQEDEIALQKWKIEDLTQKLKEAEEILERCRVRKTFAEVTNNGSV